MTTEALLLAVLLGAAPGSTLVHAPEPPICVDAAPVPERVDATHFEDTTTNGTRIYGVEATYLLSGGEVGEAFLIVDSAGAGEAHMMIDGEVIAHVSITLESGTDQPVVTTWYPDAGSHSPESIAEMMRIALLPESIPQEFKCSPWGRKVMKAGKYMAAGLIGAAGAACCIASQGIACIACGAGVGVGIMAADEFADGYCD